MSRRAMTLVELMAVISLSTGVLLVLYEAVHTGTRWAVAARDVVSEDEQRELLQRVVGEELGRGVLAPGLAVAPDGALCEVDRPDAAERWGFTPQPAALVTRHEGAYRVLVVEGRALVRRQIGFGGQLERQPLLTGLASATFVPERVGAELRGVAWRVIPLRGRPVSGFVACRRESPPASPPDPPALAPRWKGRSAGLDGREGSPR